MSYTPTEADRVACLNAALILREEAGSMRICHTLDGEWPEKEAETKDEHDSWLALAAELEALAERMKP